MAAVRLFPLTVPAKHAPRTAEPRDEDWAAPVYTLGFALLPLGVVFSAASLIAQLGEMDQSHGPNTAAR